MFVYFTALLLVQPLVWILTDPRPLRERIKHYFKLKSIAFAFVELLILLGTYVSVKFFPWPKTSIDNFFLTFGVVFFFAGLVLAIWAKIEMKSNWGLPAELDTKRQNTVIKSGPFAFSRNPIYVGLIFTLLGYTLALRSYTILLVPFIAFYLYKAVLKEEKILTRHFGQDYVEYKSKVRRFIA